MPRSMSLHGFGLARWVLKFDWFYLRFSFKTILRYGHEGTLVFVRNFSGGFCSLARCASTAGHFPDAHETASNGIKLGTEVRLHCQ